MAGRIRDEDVAHVREHSHIDDVVGDYVQLKGAGGGQKKGLCPFHDEKSPSFHVTPSKLGPTNCFMNFSHTLVFLKCIFVFFSSCVSCIS